MSCKPRSQDDGRELWKPFPRGKDGERRDGVTDTGAEKRDKVDMPNAFVVIAGLSDRWPEEKEMVSSCW